MVRACVTALRFNIRYIAVVFNNCLDESSEVGVNVVRNDSNRLRFARIYGFSNISGLLRKLETGAKWLSHDVIMKDTHHILLQHSFDISLCLFIT
jgi:hypothetical protein